MRRVLLLAIVAGLTGCDQQTRRLLDTPAEHQERLICEMTQMDDHKKSADDAEAYCDKQMEARQ